jgi:hypothetical protein
MMPSFIEGLVNSGRFFGSIRTGLDPRPVQVLRKYAGRMIVLAPHRYLTSTV